MRYPFILSVLAVSVVGVIAVRHKALTHPSLRDALSLAQDVSVGYVSDGQVCPMTWLSDEKNPRMIALLRSTQAINRGSTATAGDARLYISTHGRIAIEKEPCLMYSTTNGRLWLRDEYAYVPTEFRK